MELSTRRKDRFPHYSPASIFPEYCRPLTALGRRPSRAEQRRLCIPRPRGRNFTSTRGLAFLVFQRIDPVVRGSGSKTARFSISWDRLVAGAAQHSGSGGQREVFICE